MRDAQAGACRWKRLLARPVCMPALPADHKEAEGVRAGDHVTVRPYARTPKHGRIVGFDERDHYSQATGKSYRRAWVIVRLDSGGTETYPPAQVEPYREGT